MAQQTLVGHGFLSRGFTITLEITHKRVGLIWRSDKPDAGASNKTHTHTHTHTRVKICEQRTGDQYYVKNT